MSCPLCGSESVVFFDRDKFRNYIECKECSLVYVPRDEIISPLEEKKRYDAHKNNEQDQRYRDYLGQIAESFSLYLSPGSSGLDFGSGKTKVMEEILRDKNFEIQSYDLFYHPDQIIFERKYDFVLMIEVIEHLRDLQSEIEKLKNLLAPAGKLVIKTKLIPEKGLFSKWFYKRDLTHVQFFTEKSLRNLGFKQITILSEDLFLLND